MSKAPHKHFPITANPSGVSGNSATPSGKENGETPRYAVFLLENEMLNKTETLKLIKSIGTHGKKLDSDIQLACQHAVFYSVCYGDITIGQSLYENFPHGSCKTAMVNFLERFGQFEHKDNKLVYRENDKFYDMLEDADVSEDYAMGIKTHWTAMKP